MKAAEAVPMSATAMKRKHIAVNTVAAAGIATTKAEMAMASVAAQVPHWLRAHKHFVYVCSNMTTAPAAAAVVTITAAVLTVMAVAAAAVMSQTTGSCVLKRLSKAGQPGQ